jgi:hypothetical protein
MRCGLTGHCYLLVLSTIYFAAALAVASRAGSRILAAPPFREGGEGGVAAEDSGSGSGLALLIPAIDTSQSVAAVEAAVARRTLSVLNTVGYIVGQKGGKVRRWPFS